MEQLKLMERLEGYRRRNNADHCYVNGELYRLFYNRDMYIIAYNSVKSNDGAETSGADGTSLHGFCEEWITELIASMRDESYQPQPNRTTMIPKSNGKMRKLSFLTEADDFLIGVIAPKSYATELKQKIKAFLQDELHLRLSDEKTKITHAADKDVSFLGYIIRKGTGKHWRFQNNPFDSAIRIFMNTDGILKKLRENGMCTSNGYPIGITRLLKEPPEDIIKYGNQVLRGLLTQQRGCLNFYQGWRIQYIEQYSMAKTLARKFDISAKKVFAGYGNSLTVNYKNAKDKACSVNLALYKSFAKQKNFFAKIKSAAKAFSLPKYSLRNPLSRVCYICGNPHFHVSMFHRKTKKKLEKPYSPIVTVMLAINRRQIPLCEHCFANVEANRFQLNQLKQR